MLPIGIQNTEYVNGDHSQHQISCERLYVLYPNTPYSKTERDQCCGRITGPFVQDMPIVSRQPRNGESDSQAPVKEPDCQIPDGVQVSVRFSCYSRRSPGVGGKRGMVCSGNSPVRPSRNAVISATT